MKVELKEKASEIAEEIADETFGLIGKKIKYIIDFIERNQVMQEKIVESLKRLERRIDSSTNGFKDDMVESETMLSEKFEELRNENEESVLNLVSEVQELRDMVVSLKGEVNRLKGHSL